MVYARFQTNGIELQNDHDDTMRWGWQVKMNSSAEIMLLLLVDENI